MAHKTKLCKYCKHRYPVEDGVQINAGFFCSFKEAAKWGVDQAEKKRLLAQAKAAKEIKSVNAKKKRDFYDSDLKTRKASAKKACHDYIKIRDAGLNCICCNREMPKNEVGHGIDAGHFLESGNYSSTRYDEDNIHSQSVHCNRHKGGDSGDYEKNLRLKIGDERVDALIAKKNIVIKRTAQDYREIEDYYREKIKELEAKT